jgi:hypothetical protein
MAKKYQQPNLGSSPLDGIANSSAAVQALWRKIKGKKPLGPTEFAKAKANSLLTAAADKAGVTLHACKHRRTHKVRNSVHPICNDCGNKIM